MDNLCHTLAGAAFGESGLKRRTRLGSATLMIASNLPDLDVLVFATSVPSVAFRRGWTHGIVAQALLPLALAAVMLMIARRRPAKPDDPPASFIWLLLLSYLGLCCHVFMDFLNNYGVRWLYPLRTQWFYGDTLFIIDPWLWLILGGGIWLARRRRVPRPARMAVGLAALYIVAMLMAARAARDIVTDAWTAANGSAPQALMVGPMPVTPLQRAVVLDAGDHYATGTFTWLPPEVRFDPETVPKNAADPRVAAARDADGVRGFLVWSRFPVWVLEPVAGGTRVTVGDMRFTQTPALLRRRGAFTASTTVTTKTD
jgi:inner membrane protein